MRRTIRWLASLAFALPQPAHAEEQVADASNPCVLTNAEGRCVQWAFPTEPPEPSPALPLAPVDGPVSPEAPVPGASDAEALPTTEATVDAAAAPLVESAPRKKAVAGIVPGESAREGGRTLRGHTFQFPRLIDNAFPVASIYVGSSVEFLRQPGVVATVPTTTGSRETITFDRAITLVRSNYAFDVRPAPSFSVGLETEYLAEVGTNSETLFTWGGSGGYDIRPNLKIRLARGDRTGTQVAVRAHAGFQGGLRAVPLGLLLDISNQIAAATADPAVLADCLVKADFSCLGTPDVASDITASRRRFSGGGALALAQALGRNAGAQFAVGIEGASTSSTMPLGGGQKTTLDSKETVVYAGISPSLNFYPFLPIGFTVEYRFELNRISFDANESVGLATPIDVDAISHRINGGFYYTGRRDLLLGWIGGIHLLRDAVHSGPNAATDAVARVLAAQFDMRYFF